MHVEAPELKKYFIYIICTIISRVPNLISRKKYTHNPYFIKVFKEKENSLYI